MTVFKQIVNLTIPILRLHTKGRRLAIGIDVASTGEVQFFRNVALALADAHPDILFYFFYRDPHAEFTFVPFPNANVHVAHIRVTPSTFELFWKLDLFITTEQFISGPPSVYTLTLFHGQPSKGVTFKLFDHDPLSANDALFMYGPLQKQALQEHLLIFDRELPEHLSLFEIGYTKSDPLLKGGYDRKKVLRDIGLDPAKKTILYAPAFNPGASMREYAAEIINVLGVLDQYNVLAKLAIDCLDRDLVGGIDWYSTVKAFETKYPNFRMVHSLEVDPALAASDVLITCVSSVGFEFLALKRPVIFIDTPKFFRESLQAFFPDRDVSTWVDRMAVNGGREFGLVVSKPNELPAAIKEVLTHPDTYPRRQDELPGYLLYNPGEATLAAVTKIEELLARKARSKRQVAASLPNSILPRLVHKFLGPK